MINSNIVSEIAKIIQHDTQSDYYIGIATNIKQRLFGDHNVSELFGTYAYFKANSEQEARDTECFLLKNTQCCGGTGGGKCPTYVYVYKKTLHTVQ